MENAVETTVELNTCTKCGGEVTPGRETCQNCDGATTTASASEELATRCGRVEAALGDLSRLEFR
jgi:uncharacterized OB-fold protein